MKFNTCPLAGWTRTLLVVTVAEAVEAELLAFREQMREALLTGLEGRAPLALKIAEERRGARMTPLEALHAGYQLGLLDIFGALEEGAELIATKALERFNQTQN